MPSLLSFEHCKMSSVGECSELHALNELYEGRQLFLDFWLISAYQALYMSTCSIVFSGISDYISHTVL